MTNRPVLPIIAAIPTAVTVKAGFEEQKKKTRSDPLSH